MKRLNSTTKLVLQELQSLAQVQGTNSISPTNSYLASLVERGNREITRALNDLQAAGLLKVDLDPSRSPLRIIILA
jgi:hypothetical protein